MQPLFEQRLTQAWPPAEWQDVRVVVAVSGGPDSVALLRALLQLSARDGGRLVAAHFNHRLRAEADVDEQFVIELCCRLSIPCEVGHAAVPATEPPGSLEEAARSARYRFLAEIAQRQAARFVVTGHTADDQAETILHRILRGTGWRGLAGIPRSRELAPGVTLLRPLRSFTRAELLEYLRTLNQSFREDDSNLSLQFTRNRIRHELLPLLAAEYNPHIQESLLRLGELAREASAYLEFQAAPLRTQSVTREGATLVVDCRRLSDQPRILLSTMFTLIWRSEGWPEQAMTFAKWAELAELVTGPQSYAKLDFPGAIRVVKHDGQLRLARP